MSNGVPVRRPDFLGVGFRRCASSWLHSALSEHPQIGKPKSGLHFFGEEEKYRCKKRWYLKQLEPWHGKDVIGEVSVSYTYPDRYECASERIKKMFPEVNIFCSVRNPMERAYSDYRRSIYLNEIEPITFEEALHKYPEYIQRGMYGKIISRYMDLFGENVKVFFYDDLQKNPHRYVKDVYNFLGVDDEFTPSVIEAPMGHAKLVENRRIHLAMTKSRKIISKSCRSIGLGFILQYWKLIGARGLLGRENKRNEVRVNPETYRYLVDVYKEDINLLSSITGRNLSKWTEL